MKNRNKKIIFSMIIVLIAIFGIIGVNQLNNILTSKVTPKDEILLADDKGNKSSDDINKKSDEDKIKDENKAKDENRESKQENKSNEDKSIVSDKTKENNSDNNEKTEQSTTSKSRQVIKSTGDESKKAKTNVNKNNNTSTNNKEITEPKGKENIDKAKSIENHEKKQVIQMVILDTVNNKTLFSGQVPLKNNKENFNTIMNNFLKSNRVKHINRGGYIAMMYGLSEFDAGPNSGWCYYVNGVKSPVGIAGYNPKNGDKIVWKFLEDGVNN